MKTILLSFLAFATLFLFSSAAPLDKTIDEFTNALGLGELRGDKKPLSKKVKPPPKLPGPKLFPEAKGFEFLSQIPAKVIPKINALRQDDNQRRKKHLFKTHHYFAPLKEEPKRASLSLREVTSKAPQDTRTVTENQKKTGKNMGWAASEPTMDRKVK